MFSKSKTKTLSLFSSFFSSQKSKRAVFFVLLAVLILGFSLPLQSHAIGRVAGSTPQPGEKLSELSQGWQDQINNSNNILSFTNVFNRDVKAGGIVPTSPNEYGAFLKVYGGYDWNQVNNAGIWNAKDLTADPKKTGGLLTYSDNDMLKSWTDGKSLDRPFWNYGTQPVAQAASTAGGAINSAVGAVGGFISDALLDIVLEVVITVLTAIAGFCKLLLMFSGWVLDATLNPNLYNFTNNKMIVDGWIIIRDVCNLFFLLVLLFIAICTILKIEKYHAKKTLLTLIIMALLINFSKPIAIFIFDGSQLLMNMFLSKMGGPNSSPSAMFVRELVNLIYVNLMTNLKAMGGDKLNIAIYYLFVVVFLFMFAVAMFVTAIFLVIRIVAVMILIIVSPLAFFAAIVPDLSKMSSSWWSALFKYCYYGPAAAFFLYLATNFALGNVLPKLNSPNESSIITSLITNITILVFLYASIIMSQQFGIFAANAIVGNANRFMKWGAGMTKTGGVWGAAGRTTGITGGVSQRLQQSGLTRWMTKEGRKRNQKAMEARVAGALGVTGARTKRLKEAADDLKNESNSNIVRMAQGGDLVAAYVASNRGILDDQGQIINAIMPQLTRDEDMRNEFVRNARKNGQTHQALQIRMQTAAHEDNGQIRQAFQQGNIAQAQQLIADNEMGRVATSDLVKNQNIGQLAQIPQALNSLTTIFNGMNNRLMNGTPQQQAAAQQQLNNIISDASAQNIQALQNNNMIP